MALSVLRLLVWPFLLVPIAAALVTRQGPDAACTLFSQTYPNITSFPGEEAYINDNTSYYDIESALGPACIFAPSTAQQMSYGVTSLVNLSVPFAVRGGGHMPIAGYANINSSGVLLSSTNLKTLQISADKSVVSIGPGHRWVDVYDYIEPYGVSVAGGRIGVVGVPGYILGGGFSFFNGEVGWTSSTMQAAECVLASGEIVEATATNEYSDLFWALKGGGNSFCIATRFDLRAMPIAEVQVGNVLYRPGIEGPFLDAAYWFAKVGSKDTNAAVIPLMTYIGTIDAATYEGIIFYNGNDESPPALQNFTAALTDPGMTPVVSTISSRSLASWCTEIDAPWTLGIYEGLRSRFHVVPVYASLEAITIVHDAYLSAAREVTGVSGFMAALAFVPISEAFVTASNANGGSPQGVDASQAPYFWIEENISWSDGADDATAEAFIDSVNQDIDSKLGSMKASFYYLNDAAPTQPVWQGFPAANVAKLKEIRAKYDPNLVYTNLMPGGWKVAHAP